MPHRLAVSGIWELPFGRGRHWARDAGGLLDASIGGWSLQAIGQLQSGRPISFHDRNIYFNGDLDALKTDYHGRLEQSGVRHQRLLLQRCGGADQRRSSIRRSSAAISASGWPTTSATSPRASPGLRSQPLNLWDISLVKQVRFGDRLRAQFHVEFLNAFNHPVFSNPNTDPTNANFGKVTSQGNLPRDIQLAAKILF